MESLMVAFFALGALAMNLVYVLCYALKNEIKLSHIAVSGLVFCVTAVIMFMVFWAWLTLTLGSLSITIKPDALWDMGMNFPTFH